MRPPSIGPTTPRHLSRHLHLPINQVPSPNEDTGSSAQSPAHIIQESVLDTPNAILLTPTHPCTMPSLPPQVYLKCIPFTHVPSLIATPHHSNMILVGALAARVDGLESEVTLLQEKNKELHQLMEDQSDFMNMQLLFLGSFAEHTMELNAEKK